MGVLRCIIDSMVLVRFFKNTPGIESCIVSFLVGRFPYQILYFSTCTLYILSGRHGLIRRFRNFSFYPSIAPTGLVRAEDSLKTETQFKEKRRK